MKHKIDKRIKCHQKIIREKLLEQDIENNNLWWNNINLSSSNAKVKIITYQQAKKIIEEYEWLGTMPKGAFLCTGLFFDNYLAGVEVFIENKAGKKYTLFNEPTTCLARGCCVHWCPTWGSSYLIAKSLKLLAEYYKGEPRYVVAFSDWEAGEIGTVYQACNWVYIGHQNYFFWVDPNGKKYDKGHHRNIAMTIDKEFKYKKKVNIEIANQIKQDLLNEGWKYREKLIRGRYATVIGINGKRKRELIKKLKENSKPYPKIHKIKS